MVQVGFVGEVVMFDDQMLATALQTHYQKTPWGPGGHGLLSNLYCHAVDKGYVPHYSNALTLDAIITIMRSFRSNLACLPAGTFIGTFAAVPNGTACFSLALQESCGWDGVRFALRQTLQVMTMLGADIDTEERWDFSNNILDVLLLPEKIHLVEPWFRDAAGRLSVVYHDRSVWVHRNW